jgi:acyl carrier protein
MREPKSGGTRAWLVATLTRLASTFEGEVSDDTPLADGGLCLDSLALTDLIGDIQTELGVTIEEEDISPETFGTVASLLEFLARRSEGHLRGAR